MAIMIPAYPVPSENDTASLEPEMFEILQKNLSNDYYVFHSVQLSENEDGYMDECEIDFVILHKEKGFLCLEAKNGKPHVVNREWLYGNGAKMSHGGPYKQARRERHKLQDNIQRLWRAEFNEQLFCKYCFGVWLYGYERHEIEAMESVEIQSNLTLTHDDVENLEEKIAALYDVDRNSYMPLSDEKFEWLLKKIAPQYRGEFVSIPYLRHTQCEYKLFRMEQEQKRLLDYLEEQDSAVINGMAGSGKTVMAIEKANRLALTGEKVLFLCYNKFLAEYLIEAYARSEIQFMTVAAFACQQCRCSSPDYLRLDQKLKELDIQFPYKHVIIDEGQDFGDETNGAEGLSNVVETLQILVKKRNGTFFLFYDKNQLIQSDSVPKFIEEADCRLTLFCNCRNTKKVAEASIRLLNAPKGKTIKMKQGAEIGQDPKMFFTRDVEQVKRIIEHVVSNRVENDRIQILTVESEQSSILSSEIRSEVVREVKRYFYECNGENIPFTTCRKFKGLEAEIVILLDINKDMFVNTSNDEDELKEKERLAYVGSSRAKYELITIANIEKEECSEVYKSITKSSPPNSHARLAAMYKSQYCDIP